MSETVKRTSSLGAARPLPPSADIDPGGQSVGQAAQFCLVDCPFPQTARSLPPRMTRSQRRGLIMARGRKWTPADDEKLRALLATGASLNRISVALDRPIAGIKAAARRLGLDLPKPKRLPREDR